MTGVRPPDSAFIELTTACNQDCLHCFADAGKALPQELTFRQIEELLQQLYEMGVIFVNFTGGEPLLREGLFEILALTTQFGNSQHYSLFTNGVLWSREALATFLKVYSQQHNWTIQISLDGYSPQTYELLRPGSARDFPRVVEAFKMFKEVNIETAAVFTVTKLNVQHALTTARFALEELDVDKFLFIPVFFTGRAATYQNKLKLDFSLWKDFVVEATLVKRDLKWGENSKRFTIGFFNFYELFPPLNSAGLENLIYEVWNFTDSAYSTRALKQTPFCQAAKTEICISAEGKVYPCVPARGTPIATGDLKLQSLKEIWQTSRGMDWFRAPRDVGGLCTKCKYKDYCGGGCRLYACTIGGDPNGLDPCCPYVEGQLPL